MCPIRLSLQTFENTAIYIIFVNLSMFHCHQPTHPYVQDILPKHCCSQCFHNVPQQKHDNLHVFGHKVGPKHSKMPLFTMFSSIFPCSIAASQLKHTCKISFQNIVFQSVFTMFLGEVIYTFLAIKSVQNTDFYNVFTNLASKNLSGHRYLRVVFHFLPISPLLEAYPSDPNFMSIHS